MTTQSLGGHQESTPTQIVIPAKVGDGLTTTCAVKSPVPAFAEVTNIGVN